MLNLALRVKYMHKRSSRFCPSFYGTLHWKPRTNKFGLKSCVV